MNDRKFFGRVEDLVSLKKKTKDHDIYYCPYCVLIRGKPDNDGKFYFSPTKGKGLCFKCDARIVVSDHLRSFQDIAAEFENIRTEDRYEDQKLHYGQWSVPIELHPRALTYMTKQRGITLETLEHFDVRGTDSPSPAVVFINKKLEQDYSDFVQVRLIDAPPNLRYFTIKDQIKPLAWLEKYTEPSNQNLFLVEGTISALASYQHSNFLSPIVSFGKTLTEFHQKMLSDHLSKFGTRVIHRIYICYDGGYLREIFNAAKSVYNIIPNCQVNLVILPRGKDPNEVTTYEFTTALNNSIPYAPMMSAAVWQQAIIYLNKVS